WNRQAENVTGYSAEEMATVDDYVSLLYPDLDCAVTKRRIQRAFEERREDHNRIAEITTKNHRKKLVLWNSTFIASIAEVVIGKLMVAVEVSRVERRLADIGLAASAVFHDIRSEMAELK